jgi:hypothetical protein
MGAMTLTPQAQIKGSFLFAPGVPVFSKKNRFLA